MYSFINNWPVVRAVAVAITGLTISRPLVLLVGQVLHQVLGFGNLLCSAFYSLNLSTDFVARFAKVFFLCYTEPRKNRWSVIDSWLSPGHSQLFQKYSIIASRQVQPSHNPNFLCWAGAQVLRLQQNDVLDRDEMLTVVSDLLTKKHPDLFAEFKRIIEGDVSWRAHIPPPPLGLWSYDYGHA